MKENSPILSILIPAFNYPEGMERILNILILSDLTDVEVIISDDSSSNDVENLLKLFNKLKFQNFIYIRNRKPLGAVNNWNYLITRASGKYVWLLHHDEYPLSSAIFSSLIFELKNISPDILILKCLLKSPFRGILRIHVPRWQQKFFSLLGDQYLIYHNYYGSPSSVIVRRSICPLFDPSLKLYVDIKWLLTILKIKKVFKYFSPVGKIVSIPHDNSITNSFGNNFNAINKFELNLIINHFYPKPFNIFLIFLLKFDFLFWLIFRILNFFNFDYTRNSRLR